MGIVEVEQNRLRQQEIEVRSLIALYQTTELYDVKRKCEGKLYAIAFPETLAQKINEYDTLKDKRLFDYLENTEWYVNDVSNTYQKAADLLQKVIVDIAIKHYCRG